MIEAYRYFGNTHLLVHLFTCILLRLSSAVACSHPIMRRNPPICIVFFQIMRVSFQLIICSNKCDHEMENLSIFWTHTYLCVHLHSSVVDSLPQSAALRSALCIAVFCTTRI